MHLNIKKRKLFLLKEIKVKYYYTGTVLICTGTVDYNVSSLLSIFIIRIHTVCTVLHLCMVVNRVLLLSYPNFAKSDIELLNSKI